MFKYIILKSVETLFIVLESRNEHTQTNDLQHPNYEGDDLDYFPFQFPTWKTGAWRGKMPSQWIGEAATKLLLSQPIAIIIYPILLRFQLFLWGKCLPSGDLVTTLPSLLAWLGQPWRLHSRQTTTPPFWGEASSWWDARYLGNCDPQNNAWQCHAPRCLASD